MQATVRERTVGASNMPTEQELHIARLARDWRTKPEIGAELFLSPRTIEWHVRNVFTKRGIRSRGQLRTALAPQGRDDQPGKGRSE